MTKAEARRWVCAMIGLEDLIHMVECQVDSMCLDPYPSKEDMDMLRQAAKEISDELCERATERVLNAWVTNKYPAPLIKRNKINEP